MARSKLSAEQYEEELNRQTTDLNAKRHELDDIRTMADLYQKTIEEKEKDLIIKDARLKAAKEKNEAELWQLNMELSALQERLNHSLNFHQTEVFSLSNAKQRYLDLYHENMRLKKSIEELESLYEKEVHGHASQMHSLNRERKDLRKNMEDKLRKDLAGLEIAFQQQAFDALFDGQKLAMFENAKLKDEVAMQGVGITNLTGRLAKQRKACEKCRQYLRKYKQKADRLRKQLAIVTGRKNDIAKRKKELDDEEARLTEQSQLMYDKLSVNSSVDQLSQANATVMEYIQANRELRGQEAMFDAWKSRFQQLQTLYIDLKPTTHDEQNGLYPEKLFPIYPLMRVFQNINETNPWLPMDEYLRGSEDALPMKNTSTLVSLTSNGNNNKHESAGSLNKPSGTANQLAIPDLSDDQSVSSNTSQSSFTLQSGSIHTENTSVGGQRRRLSRLKMAGDAVLSAILKEEGLLEATAAIRGKEKRIVGFIQLACEKEKAKLRRAKRQELKDEKRKHLMTSLTGGTGSMSPMVPGTTMNSRPGTTDSTGGGLGTGGKSLEPFEGQNMVAWAVMKIVQIWAQTRPPRIPDEDLKQLNAESLNLLPKSLSVATSQNSVADSTSQQSSHKQTHTAASSSVVSFADGEPLDSHNDHRARREAMKHDSSLFTPQQIADHQFHRNVLEQLEHDKRQGLILQEDRPLVGSGGTGLAHLEHDEFSIGSGSSAASLSHIDEEEEEEDEDELSDAEDGDTHDTDGENDLEKDETAKIIKVKKEGKVETDKTNTDQAVVRTATRHNSSHSNSVAVSQPTSPSPVHLLTQRRSQPGSMKQLTAAEMLYESGQENDGLRLALRREAEILQLEKERMEEELLQQQHASSSSFRFLAMSADEMDAQLALDEEMDALHQQRWHLEQEEEEEEEEEKDTNVVDPTGSGKNLISTADIKDDHSQLSSEMDPSFKKVNLKKKRAWLHKPPLYTPNPFAVQKQHELMANYLKPIETQVGGIRVQHKAAFEIGPPLLLRNESVGAGTGHSAGLRVSLSAGHRASAALSSSQLSPLVSSQATNTHTTTTATSSFASFFGNSPVQQQVDRVLTNAELRAMDPLKHRPKRSLPGVSSVRVSQKVLHQLPRSVSTPMLSLQEQQEVERGAPVRLTPLPATTTAMMATPFANTTAALPKKSMTKHRLAASTGALPRHR